MPIVTIKIVEGRDNEKKRNMIKSVTDSIVESLDVAPETVRIVIEEMKKDDFGIGGLPVMEYRLKKAKENKK